MTAVDTLAPVRPIRTEADHAAAMAEIEALWSAEPGSPAHDRLDVLTLLVDAYEAETFPMPAVDPVDFLKAAMDARGATLADLAQVLGSYPRASEILNRRRTLTLDHIRKLHDAWSIPADNLIPAYEAA